MQADALATHLATVAPHAARNAAANRSHAAPRFTFVHVLYYLGGMIAIGAMSLFMTLGWNSLGGWGGFVTRGLLRRAGARAHALVPGAKQLEIPAGIMATLAVAMVPLAIFAAQMALGYWGEDKPYRDYHVYIDWRWIMMELGTLAIGAILLWRYRFPFMLMPISVTLWYMSMDIVPFLFGAGLLGLGAAQARFGVVRPRHDAARLLGRPALALLARLCLLALPFRRAHVLGRPVARWTRAASGQARLLRHQRGDGADRRDPRPARVRGLRRAGRRRLPRAPLVAASSRTACVFPFALSAVGLGIIGSACSGSAARRTGRRACAASCPVRCAS